MRGQTGRYRASDDGRTDPPMRPADRCRQTPHLGKTSAFGNPGTAGAAPSPNPPQGEGLTARADGYGRRPSRPSATMASWVPRKIRPSPSCRGGSVFSSRSTGCSRASSAPASTKFTAPRTGTRWRSAGRSATSASRRSSSRRCWRNTGSRRCGPPGCPGWSFRHAARHFGDVAGTKFTRGGETLIGPKRFASDDPICNWATTKSVIGSRHDQDGSQADYR